MTPLKHWQDAASAAAGVLILVAPWLAGYALVQPALANSVIIGTLLFTGSLAAAVIGRAWAECGIAGLGAWMLASPWALALEDAAAIRVAVVTGGLVLLLGATALAAEWRARGRRGRAAAAAPKA